MPPLPKINAEISIVMPLNGIGLKICVKSLLTLSNGSITLKNKIVFTAILIFLVAIITYLIQQHYFQSYRDTLTPADLLISAVPKFGYEGALYPDFIEFQRQLGI
jgi:hypothetical protein